MYTKEENKSVLLTTGVTERNSILNIYDLAGNVHEWILEYTSLTGFPCAIRGGYYNNGTEYPAFYHDNLSITYSDNSVGYRPALW